MNEKSPASSLSVLATHLQIAIAVLSLGGAAVGFVVTQLKEARTREIEASRSFLELRRTLYLDALKQAAILSSPADHTDAERQAALKRFRELYVVELSMVESKAVEAAMVALATKIDPTLANLKDDQLAAYNLAHAVRDSLVKSWGVKNSD